MTSLGTYEFELAANTSKAEGGLSRLRGGINSLGGMVAKSAAAMGALGVAIAGASVKLAADFEQSIASAAARTDDFEGAMVAFEAAAVEAGLSSAYSATQAADALGMLAQAGLSIVEATEAVPDVLALAAAGALGLSEATDIAMGVMQGFSLEVSDLSHVADVLAYTANAAATDVSLLGQTMSYAAPVATGLGLSLEEVSAAAGMLANANIKGSRAGTSMNAIMAQLRKAAKELGVDLDHATIGTEGLAGVLDILQEAGLSSGNALELFGQQAGPAMQALLAQGTDALREMTEAIENSGGTAQEVADKQLNTLSGQMQILTGMLETVGVRTGQVFLPALRVIVDITRDATAGTLDASDGMSKLDDMLIKLSKSMSVFVRAATPILSFMSTLGAIAVEVGKVIAGVFKVLGEGIGASAALMFQIATGDFRGAWETIKNGALDAVGTTMDTFRNMGSSFSASQKLNREMEKIGDMLADSFEKGADDIVERAASAVEAAERDIPPLKVPVTFETDKASIPKIAPQVIDVDFGGGGRSGTSGSNREFKRAMDERYRRMRGFREKGRRFEEERRRELERQFDEELRVRRDVTNSFERALSLRGMRADLKALEGFTDPLSEYLRSGLTDAIKEESRVIEDRAKDALRSLGMEIAYAVDEGLGRAIDSAMRMGGLGMNIGAQFGPEGAAAGAAIGAILGTMQALWDMAQQTEEFERLTKMVNAKLDAAGIELPTLQGLVGKAVEALTPAAAGLMEAFSMFRDAIEPVVKVIGAILPNMEDVQRVFFDAMVDLSFTVMNVARTVASVGHSLLTTIFYVANTINEVVSKIPGINNPLGAFLDRVEGMRDSFGDAEKALDSAMDNIMELDFGEVKDSMDDFNESIQSATDSVENVPTVFRRELRRSQAGRGGGGDFASRILDYGAQLTGGVQPASFSGNTFVVVANEPEELIDKLRRRRWVEDGDSRHLGVNLRELIFDSGA